MVGCLKNKTIQDACKVIIIIIIIICTLIDSNSSYWNLKHKNKTKLLWVNKGRLEGVGISLLMVAAF